MPLTLSPSRRIVNEIRAHLEAPGHEHRRWSVPSLSGAADRTVSIVASRDEGVDLGPGQRYASLLHLSFVGHVGSVPDALLDEDLNGWGRAILGAMAPYANVEPPARPGDHHYLSIWSPVTTHARVYLDQRGRPLLPSGELAVTPWRAA
jgi:hypothetical protein